MYIVHYQKVIIKKDGTLENISLNKDVAYMDCKFPEIEQQLVVYLKRSCSKEKYAPVINQVKYHKGHLV